jgi:hypothetical protein
MRDEGRLLLLHEWAQHTNAETRRAMGVTIGPELVALIADLIDGRLIFLARASARHTLGEAGEMELEEAIGGVLDGDRCPLCERLRWPLAEKWERTHPPRRNWRRR